MGITRLGRAKNDDLRADMETDSILELLERGQLLRFWHVKRMNGYRYARNYFEWRQVERRRERRPIIRYRDGVGGVAERRWRTMEEVEEMGANDDRQ